MSRGERAFDQSWDGLGRSAGGMREWALPPRANPAKLMVAHELDDCRNRDDLAGGAQLGVIRGTSNWRGISHESHRTVGVEGLNGGPEQFGGLSHAQRSLRMPSR